MSEALKKLAQEDAEKEKNYKSPVDAERVYYLIHAATLMKDFVHTAAIAASFMKELRALNLKQADLDAKDTAEHEKKMAEARAADARSTEEAEEKETNGNPRQHAPSVPRRM